MTALSRWRVGALLMAGLLGAGRRVAADTPTVFVVGADLASVAILSEATERVAFVSAPLITGAGVSADGNRLYLASDGDMAIFDFSSAFARTAVPADGLAMAQAADAPVTIEACNQQCPPGASSVLRRFDAGTGTVTAFVPLPVRSVTFQVTPDGQRAAVLRSDPTSLITVDLEGQRILGTVPMPWPQADMTLSATGHQAFVQTHANGGLGAATVQVDLDTGAEVKQLPTSESASALVLSPAGDTIYTVYSYVADEDEPRLIAQDVATGTVRDFGGLPPSPLRAFPRALAIDASGTRLFVADSANDRLHVVDVATGAVVASRPTGLFPHVLRVGGTGEVPSSATAFPESFCTTPATKAGLRLLGDAVDCLAAEARARVAGKARGEVLGTCRASAVDSFTGAFGNPVCQPSGGAAQHVFDGFLRALATAAYCDGDAGLLYDGFDGVERGLVPPDRRTLRRETKALKALGRLAGALVGCERGAADARAACVATATHRHERAVTRLARRVPCAAVLAPVVRTQALHFAESFAAELPSR